MVSRSQHVSHSLRARALACLLFATMLLAAGASSRAVTLYDGSAGNLPGGAPPFGWSWREIFLPLDGHSTLVQQGGARLRTTVSRTDKHGFFSQPPVIPPLPVPTLVRQQGFNVRLEVEVLSEGHNPVDHDLDGIFDRAGFSAIVISDDLLGLELAFWDDEIWAYAISGTDFVHAEGVLIDATVKRVYDIQFGPLTYTLSSYGVPLLTGPLRDYRPGAVPLPDVYEWPNFLFFGDDTSSADSETITYLYEIDDHQTVPWLGAAGAGPFPFGTAAHWGGPVPDLADIATFGVAAPPPASTSVQLDQNRTNSGLTIGNIAGGNSISVDLNASLYEIIGRTKVGSQGTLFLQGPGTLDTSVLEVDGALNVQPDAALFTRHEATIDGALRVNASDARFELTSSRFPNATRTLNVGAQGALDIAAGLAVTSNTVHDVQGSIDVHVGGELASEGHGHFEQVVVRDAQSLWTHTTPNDQDTTIQDLSVNAGGAVETSGAGSLRLLGTATIDGAASYWHEQSGSFQNDGTLEVLASATFDVPFDNVGTVRVDSGVLNLETLENTGSVEVEGAGGQLVASGQITNHPTASLSVDIAGAASTPFLDNAGLVDLGTGSTFSAGGVLNAGTVALAAGNAASVGGYVQSVDGSLHIDILGEVPGAFGTLAVTGGVSLAGDLSVFLNFVPTPGVEFVILANDLTDSISGAFTGIAEGTTVSVAGVPLRASYVGGDGNDFTLTAVCGNAVVDPGEACDDGGIEPGDGCSERCRIEAELGLVGTAVGGSVRLTVNGVTLIVSTDPGASAVVVLQDLANAILANQELGEVGTSAFVSGGKLVTDGSISHFTILDAGFSGGVWWESWTRLDLVFANLGRAEASATATGLAMVTTPSSTSSHLSTLWLPFSPNLALDAAIPVTDPNSMPVTSVIVESVRGRPDLQGGVLGNISGAIASTVVGLLPNTIPATGGLTFCLLVAPLPPCVSQLNLPVGGTTAGVQIGAGVGGILTIGGTGTVRISLVGAPYTVKTVSVVNRTHNGGFDAFVENGFAHGPLSNTSSTAAAGGVLQIVSANHTTTVGLGGDRSGSISRLLIHFAPEPDLLLLLASGAAASALLGRWRARQSTKRRSHTEP